MTPRFTRLSFITKILADKYLHTVKLTILNLVITLSPGCDLQSCSDFRRQLLITLSNNFLTTLIQYYSCRGNLTHSTTIDNLGSIFANLDYFDNFF